MSAQDPFDDPRRQYLTGQLRPTHPALLAGFEAASLAATHTLAPRLDLPYGPHPRQTFDLFLTRPDAPTLAFLHAGYWQSRDKATFRFLAADAAAAGFNFAAVNYPLCPEVSVAEIVEAVRAFPAALARESGAGALIAVGHSAGAHLAVELALTDWPARGVSASPVRAVVGLSGVYDLSPLIETPLNDKLKLTATAARAASPVWRVTAPAPPALFVVGGEETPAFQRQNADMAAAWRAAGLAADALTVEGADHFSLLGAFAQPASPFLRALAALARPR